MTNKLQPKDKELLARISEVLFYRWDPIGVSDFDDVAPRDEYDSYVPHIFTLLKKHSSVEVVANHLTDIAVSRMGLNQNSERDLRIADLLLDWMKYYEEKEN